MFERIIKQIQEISTKFPNVSISIYSLNVKLKLYRSSKLKMMIGVEILINANKKGNHILFNIFPTQYSQKKIV